MTRVIYKERGILNVVCGKEDCVNCLRYCRENGLPYLMDGVKNEREAVYGVEKAWNGR